METRTKITEINAADIAHLLSTALYGSSFLRGSYSKDTYPDLSGSKEERMAEILLEKRGSISIYDDFAEGEVYGNLPYTIKGGSVIYDLFLNDFIEGLERCADGKFNANEEGERCRIRRDFAKFAGDDSRFDRDCAENLMQVILFNEIIYA